MRGIIDSLRRLAAVLAVIALGFAPVVTALTHGPDVLVAEADHAVWHAEQGHAEQGGPMDQAPHHDASDHDHSTAVILPDSFGVAVTTDRRAAARNPFRFRDTTQEGPRRPPRSQV